jgi:hypothetical protein
LFAVFFVLAAVFFKDFPKRLSKIVYTKQYSLNQLDANGKFYDMVRSNIPKGSVVMVNLPMTTWWTTYFPHYIVAHAFDFVLPPNIDPVPRKEDVKYFYSNPVGAKSINILEKYGVEYVVFNSDKLNLESEDYGKIFKPLYVSPRFSIYKLETGK